MKAIVFVRSAMPFYKQTKNNSTCWDPVGSGQTLSALGLVSARTSLCKHEVGWVQHLSPGVGGGGRQLALCPSYQPRAMLSGCSHCPPSASCLKAGFSYDRGKGNESLRNFPGGKKLNFHRRARPAPPRPSARPTPLLLNTTRLQFRSAIQTQQRLRWPRGGGDGKWVSLLRLMKDAGPRRRAPSHIHTPTAHMHTHTHHAHTVPWSWRPRAAGDDGAVAGVMWPGPVHPAKTWRDNSPSQMLRPQVCVSPFIAGEGRP